VGDLTELMVAVGDELWIGGYNGLYWVGRDGQSHPIAGIRGTVRKIVPFRDEGWGSVITVNEFGHLTSAALVQVGRDRQARRVEEVLGPVNSIVPVGDRLWIAGDRLYWADRNGQVRRAAGPATANAVGAILPLEGDVWVGTTVGDRG